MLFVAFIMNPRTKNKHFINHARAERGFVLSIFRREAQPKDSGSKGRLSNKKESPERGLRVEAPDWSWHTKPIPGVFYKTFSEIILQISDTFAFATNSNFTFPRPLNHISSSLSISKTPAVSTEKAWILL